MHRQPTGRSSSRVGQTVALVCRHDRSSPRVVVGRRQEQKGSCKPAHSQARSGTCNAFIKVRPPTSRDSRVVRNAVANAERSTEAPRRKRGPVERITPPRRLWLGAITPQPQYCPGQPFSSGWAAFSASHAKFLFVSCGSTCHFPVHSKLQ